MKQETEYFCTDLTSPYEQYRKMLIQEKTEVLNERAKGWHKYTPNSHFVKSGHRARCAQTMFTIGKKLQQSPLTIHLGVKLLDRVFSI